MPLSEHERALGYLGRVQGSPWKWDSVGYDPRYPHTNQSKRCFQNFVDYHKCIRALGEDHAPCQQFLREYTVVCPNHWVEKWNEQLENGNCPLDLDPIPQPKAYRPK